LISHKGQTLEAAALSGNAILPIIGSRPGHLVVSAKRRLRLLFDDELLSLSPTYPRLSGLGGCSGDTGGDSLSIGGGGIMFGGMKAFWPGHGVTAKMQSRSIGAAASAASMISRSDPGSAAIAA
jgi:hypothetical protein